MVNIKKDILLKDYVSIKIGGPAKFFCLVKNKEDLRKALLWALNKGEKFLILGGGSNIIFPDKGFDGLVIKLENKKAVILELPPDFQTYLTKTRRDYDKFGYLVEGADTLVEVEAGFSLSSLISWAHANNLCGLEWFSGIPGTVGGAVYGNVHGGPEFFSNRIYKVRFLDEDLNEKELCQKDLKFDYDYSIFKENNWIVTSVGLGLLKGDQEKIDQGREFVKAWVSKKFSNWPKLPNSGSIFQNISTEKKKLNGLESQSAGYIIDLLGLKGTEVGDIAISNEHANVFVNKGNGSSEDFIGLVDLVKNKVKEKYNINLKLEIRIIR